MKIGPRLMPLSRRGVSFRRSMKPILGRISTDRQNWLYGAQIPNEELLPPAQVAQFKREVDQVRHQSWIEQYGHLASFDLATWERIAVSGRRL